MDQNIKLSSILHLQCYKMQKIILYLVVTSCLLISCKKEKETFEINLQATTPTEGMDGLYIEDISNG